MAFLGRKVCTLYPQRFCQWPAPTECPVAEGKGLRVSWSPFHHGGHYLEHWSCSVDAGEVDGNSTTLSSISTEEHRTQAAQAARHTDSVTLRREFLEDCGSFQHCCGVKLFVKEGSTQSLLEDLKILAECRRRALPGGHRRVFRTRTSLTWSMPTGSTSSAGTGNPPAHPGPWSLCPTEPGSTVAAMMSWRGCWWGSGCWCSPMTTCLKNMLIFLAFVNMRVTLLPEEFPGAQPVVGSVKSRVRSGREALAASMSLPVGHGQSEGERMVVSDFQVFIRDVLQHVDVVQKDHPGLPIFLLGHSMGGAIAILTAAERPSHFSGMVLISPLVLANPESATTFKVDNYNTDPLICRAGLKVCFGIQLLNAVSRVERALPKLTLPFLLLQGSADRLCDSRGAYLLMESAKSQDKTLKIYEGAYHVLHKELPEVTSSVFREINTWVSQRTAAAVGTGSPP
ncbi:monoglyceride lipase isoform X4 [Hippopotamus amphibius kiboko]|uniref:monoglyceride lipase isoform X4 n=1 Tax=Hippopotamus amphibius kiboko TaxID=575201 RepID=UPI002594AAA6|nr:monoglyceride lipase isoform X4 [Hippopotamus amphibius kiboko]